LASTVDALLGAYIAAFEVRLRIDDASGERRIADDCSGKARAPHVDRQVDGQAHLTRFHAKI